MGQRKGLESLEQDRRSRLRRKRAWLVRRGLPAVLAACVVLGWALASRSHERGPSPPVYGYEVVNVYPHDPAAFCQGLAFSDGFLYESTGLRGQSTLRRVNPETGEVTQSIDLDSSYFGEGLARVGQRLYQLTWTSEVGFIYDISTFKTISGFPYTGDGWGLCYDGVRLIMSNGSSQLSFRDPDTFEQLSTVVVTLDGQPRDRLNELESHLHQ